MGWGPGGARRGGGRGSKHLHRGRPMTRCSTTMHAAPGAIPAPQLQAQGPVGRLGWGMAGGVGWGPGGAPRGGGRGEGKSNRNGW